MTAKSAKEALTTLSTLARSGYVVSVSLHFGEWVASVHPAPASNAKLSTHAHGATAIEAIRALGGLVERETRDASKE